MEVPETEYFDESREEFVIVKARTLTMEHSLLSLSKWEAKWKKPFLHSDKTAEEVIDYYRCMTITQNVDPNIYYSFTPEMINRIHEYINDNQTATTFSNNGKKPEKHEIITSELLYFYMLSNSVPSEYEKWHLSRLLTLLKICSIKNNPKQPKMSQSAIHKQNRSLNAARRAKLHTHG